MKIHEIKISSFFFEDVQTGVKQFELRKNDRDYNVGDLLRMNEIKDTVLTGRTVSVRVIYKLENYVGLETGYCILGIRKE